MATTEDGLNTAVAVAVDGDGLESPLGGLEVWEWTWTWERDESESLDALAGVQPGSWSWIWGDPDANGGPHRGESARDQLVKARATAPWSWSWSWTRDGVADWAWGGTAGIAALLLVHLDLELVVELDGAAAE